MIAADAHAPAFAVGAAITIQTDRADGGDTIIGGQLTAAATLLLETFSNLSFTPPRSQTSFSLPASD
ncbi:MULTISPECIES: hypothetical protein [unclassified Mesorhizobium]|uniref:hypothetical protein n=1 Tax=unclassified Mesorhizobium TaxID=325217 RepID=UPI000FD44328|nr:MULTISPECIES: hypothetical protein [unclassified Mesorhizobium]RUW47439.1 hypothetical protein EOA32_28815 [Mesorhizobium sp. M1A.F.Ca.ET.072.01.1.1]TIV04081.1 MAG: hypothetical protein E5W04_05165 [Mesorhizobium sp.]